MVYMEKILQTKVFWLAILFQPNVANLFELEHLTSIDKEFYNFDQ